MSGFRPNPRRSGGGRVPRALRLAARLLPADAREEVFGDLVEHWRRRRGGEVGPWLEIVGVVPDYGMNLSETTHPEGLYVPLGAAAFPLSVAVRAGPGAARLAPRLREVAAEVAPTLRMERLMDLEAVVSAARVRERAGYLSFAVLCAVAFLLSLSGVHALLSFTVSRRRHEIGVRAALGAHPLRIVADLSRRALLQVGLGAVLGGALTALLGATTYAEEGPLLFARVAAVVVGAGLLSCAVPVRRALRVEPTEAMRAE